MKIQQAKNLFKFVGYDDSYTFFSEDRYKVWKLETIKLQWRERERESERERERERTQMTFEDEGCLVQVGNGIELEAVGFRFEPYRWRPCGVTWDSS